jgi:hypothetical protein
VIDVEVEAFQEKMWDLQRHFRDRIITLVEIANHDYAQNYSDSFKYVDLFMDLSNQLIRTYTERFELGEGNEQNLLNKIQGEYLGYEFFVKGKIHR